MAKLLKRDELPSYDSTRDGRDRLDLIKNGVPVESNAIQADRIIYHPDDSCAKHYHVGAYHVFVMLYGEGTVCSPEGCQTFTKGQVAIIKPDHTRVCPTAR